MKVRLHHPRRVLEIPGRQRVSRILADLGLDPEAFLVIRGDALLTSDSEVGDEDEIEIRPVISGGWADGAPCAA
ncbi:MAG: MoaD/ThiS family protein [Armatimonadetes bacterium]|nr:MoaD/ThiS family protein [Armatimonadota bacterium]